MRFRDKKKTKKDKGVLIKGGVGGYDIEWPTINEDGSAKIPNHETMALVSAWLRVMANLQLNDPVKARHLRHLMGFDPEKSIVDYEAVFPGV